MYKNLDELLKALASVSKSFDSLSPEEREYLATFANGHDYLQLILFKTVADRIVKDCTMPIE
jgi:hypothetical protein